MADRSRSRILVASARHPGEDQPEAAPSLREPAARSLEYWARTRGTAPALFEGDGMLTYAEWNDYADLLADGFAGRGLGAGDVIAAYCRNRLEWAVIALAAAKIDAPLVTFDAGLSAPALRERLIEAQASAVILGDGDPAIVSSAVMGLPLRLCASMDMVQPGFFNFWDLFPPAAPARFGWSQPSLIAWSAGTIGRAQCVEIPRRRSAPASVARPPLVEASTRLITVPFHRAWATTQFWAALGAGHAIVLMRAFDPVEALSAIERRRVTHWSALPETFDRLVSLPATTIAAADSSSLRELTVGGAPASSRLKAKVVSAFGPILSETYGATETGVITLMPAERGHERPGSCGRPIRGVIVEIRDAEGRKLPPDSIGEVWARTPRTLECQMIGRRDHGKRDSDGFVSTGDAGRLDADGFLYLASRAALSPQGVRRAG